MNDIPFVKYTSCGNNFVIIDETRKEVLSEEDKSKFAYQATNTCFGIGCDNLLVVQRCTDGVLSAINQTRKYWGTPPDSSGADFVFRMFEPNGDEAYSCGNGLMSIASYLYQRYGTESARIMTEVPFLSPRVINIGTDPQQELSWANMGHLRSVPNDIASQAIRRSVDQCIDALDKVTVKFRSYDLSAYTNQTSLQLSGYLVFTGEPHLVIFPNESFTDSALAKSVFSLAAAELVGTRLRRRVSIGSWLVRRIGVFLNEHLRSYFPAGINVNFARVIGERQLVEYRCFERGINRETLACGTGAVATTAVAKHLGYLHEQQITVLPHLCRWHDREAEIRVAQGSAGDWCLMGTPMLLVDGNFSMKPVQQESEAVEHFVCDTQDLLGLEEEFLMNRLIGAVG